MQNRFFPVLFSIFHFGEIQILVISIGFLLIFLLENQVKITNKSGNLHWKIETGSIFERLNRKSVVSPEGNSYRSWFECVPHPSKALGKGAIRAAASS